MDKQVADRAKQNEYDWRYIIPSEVPVKHSATTEGEPRTPGGRTYEP